MLSTVLDDPIKERSYKCSNTYERKSLKCDTTTIWRAVARAFQRSRSRAITTRSAARISSYLPSSATLGWPSSSCYSPVISSSSRSEACSKCLPLSKTFTPILAITKFSMEYLLSSLARWCRTLCCNQALLKSTWIIIWSSPSCRAVRCQPLRTSIPSSADTTSTSEPIEDGTLVRKWR